MNEKSPLLRSKVTLDNPFTAKAPKPTSVRAIQLIIEGVLKQAGLPVGNSKQIMRTHCFRKWYANQCSRAHIDYPTREYLIGQRLSGQEPSYNRMTEEDRLTEYVKAIPLLTIHSESRLQQQIQQLQSDRLQNIEKTKHKVMTELKEEYKLISKSEWELMKGEMRAIKEDILPEYYKYTGTGIHLDANYSDYYDDDE